MSNSIDIVDNERVMRIAEVQSTISYSPSQIYRMIKANTFPKPIRLGPGRVGWKSSAVQAWISSREQ